MDTKAVMLAVVVGAAGAAPAEAQIGDRTGRATGTAAGGRDRVYYDHCWEGDGARERDRDIRCDERGRAGTAYGQGGRYDARDVRRDARMDARAYRTVRAHDEMHDRLDRAHRDWHWHRGWNARDSRYRRDHEELHRRLRRMHDGWHREVGWRADHRDSRWDRRF